MPPEVVDEVTPDAQSADPKSMTNGLGLEKLLKKPSPPKDPVTGKFLKADGSPSTPKVDKQAVTDDKAGKGDDLEKRLKDTRDYATRVQQQNKELESKLAAMTKQLEVLNAKIDGTYVEPVGPSPEQLEEQRRWMERANTDRQAMYDQYGEATVNERLFNPDAPYLKLEQSDPLIMERLKRSSRPVLEAWKILERHEFETKYGTEPEAIKKAIIDEYVQSETSQLTAELKGSKQRTIETVSTLSQVQGVPRNSTPKTSAGDLNLKTLFPNFPTGTA